MRGLTSRFIHEGLQNFQEKIKTRRGSGKTWTLPILCLLAITKSQAFETIYNNKTDPSPPHSTFRFFFKKKSLKFY
jgi:hypothetical protein